MNYEIIKIVSNVMEANCYLIKYNNKTILIDPCVDVNTLKKYDVTNLEAILITHSHVDHIFYLQELIKYYNTTVYLSNTGLKLLHDDSLNLSSYFIKPLKIEKDSFKYKLLSDNEIFINELNIKCIKTPGHTVDSVCYLLGNDLFTGDTLFDRSIGRTDFPTSNSLDMRLSLKKILNFNKNFNIHPGHNNSSTIEEQKQKNYYLKF